MNVQKIHHLITWIKKKITHKINLIWFSTQNLSNMLIPASLHTHKALAVGGVKDIST